MKSRRYALSIRLIAGRSHVEICRQQRCALGNGPEDSDDHILDFVSLERSQGPAWVELSDARVGTLDHVA
jgi:hypothetical protein